MGAFKCSCGNVVGLNEVEFTVSCKDNEGWSIVVCSEECKEKYTGS